MEVMDLEAQVAALRERHSRGKISDADMELMIKGAHSKWACDHPPPRAEAEIESASPRAEGENVNIDGNEGARLTSGEMRGAVRVHTASVGGTQAQVLRSAAAASARSDAHGRRNPARPSGGGPSWTANASTSIEPQLQIAQLKKFVDGTVEVQPEDDAERRAQFHSAHLLTFMVISRCCSPVVQVALKPCRLRVDAGFQAWQFIMKTYKAMDDLYIGQLEQRLTNLEMGEHESATAYYNRAQQILACIQEELDEDTLSSYIIEEEFTLESERRKEQLLPQVNYVASKQQRPQQKWGKSGGGGDNDKQVNHVKTIKSDERSGGGKHNCQRYCFVCGDPEHFTNQCPDRVNKEVGNGQEAPSGRSQNRQPHRETAYHKDKQHLDSKDKQPPDAGTSRGKGAKEAPSDDVHHDGQPSCSMVGVVTDASAEPTISLAPEVGEDFQAVAAAVQANPTVVLLDTSCSHHLMGTREAFVEMNAEGDVHHVRGFNSAIQPV
ncbi:unnamed protein product [Closterium sp. NIES-53]